MLENNFFVFENNFYRQSKGVSTGISSAPTIANVYLSILEENYLIILKPLEYLRFIDDIFIILSVDHNIDDLINHFDYLKLNSVTQEIVNFLDLNIKINFLTGSLEFQQFVKPTNTFSYLLTTSNHPSSIIKNIPVSLFIRSRRLNTNYSDYLFFSSKIIFNLVSRGYDLNVISKAARMVGNLDRLSLIPYKQKNSNFNTSTIFFKLPFDLNFNLKSILNSNFNSFSSINYLKDSNFKLLYQMQLSISSILIHNRKLNFPKYHHYRKCNRVYCRVCSYADSSCSLNLNDFILPFMNNCSCDSKFVIYIIRCLQCNIFYIGQTNCIKNRISAHLRSFFPNSAENKFEASIAHHFKFNHPNLGSVFRFYIFRNDIFNVFDRLNLESQLILLFKHLKVKIINQRINSPYYWKTNLSLFNITNN